VEPWSTGPHPELSGLHAGYHHQVPNLTTRARVRAVLTLIAAADTTLTDLHGIGPLVAARFIAGVVDVRRSRLSLTTTADIADRD
jgi:transposase